MTCAALWGPAFALEGRAGAPSRLSAFLPLCSFLISEGESCFFPCRGTVGLVRFDTRDNQGTRAASSCSANAGKSPSPRWGWSQKTATRLGPSGPRAWAMRTPWLLGGIDPHPPKPVSSPSRKTVSFSTSELPDRPVRERFHDGLHHLRSTLPFVMWPPTRSYSERMSRTASLRPTVGGSFRNPLSTAQLRPHSRIHPK